MDKMLKYLYERFCAQGMEFLKVSKFYVRECGCLLKQRTNRGGMMYTQSAVLTKEGATVYLFRL
jgi:hypothetical protein